MRALTARQRRRDSGEALGGGTGPRNYMRIWRADPEALETGKTLSTEPFLGNLGWVDSLCTLRLSRVLETEDFRGLICQM